ncbi:RNA polymerase factor sigma-54 [Thermosediminibacter oceani]|uniref:RNA polymerase, sigma 54 subunit, RpoN/SigL n=1 Tax=Thermosediminibacter oceani (strain ATCC BAA-1034 / DSM 16646 / JW/IW-1228P) TaxID=555079 RepID=D9RZ32_THEOJ|nr:RNA polymerase factor sigma-54 [Thermosediminibacter oceani]ADL08586.1 RNA polymerase, sigma 54 subunit, RpoN/SigL [Thermosediminibacter oceani DSM 16646]
MQMNYSLTLSQTQKLLMTPELRQAITILQLSSVELFEYIEQELLNNPLLDKEEETYPGEEIKVETGAKDKDTLDWEEYLQDSYDLDFLRYPREVREEENSFENFISAVPTLQEHLVMQLRLAPVSKKVFKIGVFLIGNLDKNGYLAVGVDEAAKILKVSEKEVEEALKVIQSFDPPGIGARNIKECLLIQVEQRGIKDLKLRALIENHLNDLAEAKYTKIAERLNIPLSRVQELKDIVLTLDPKPGRNFSTANETQYIIPDAVIERVGNEYVVIMNDSVAPRLSINPYYRSLLLSEDKESLASKFLTRKLESALWLIKSIEQRRMTLYKVIKAIIDVQREFLDYGISGLKPLTLKQIADKIGVHESTVSRAISGKYVQTPRGVFELKFFFKNGLENLNGSATSSETIKKMLKEMISREDPYNPLSDQKISDNFKKNGIIISRRTVAKYREELGIPSSAKRKRY